MIILAIAISIDALVIGITFSIVKITIITAVLVIGSVTFLMSLAGVKIGCSSRSFLRTNGAYRRFRFNTALSTHLKILPKYSPRIGDVKIKFKGIS